MHQWHGQQSHSWDKWCGLGRTWRKSNPSTTRSPTVTMETCSDNYTKSCSICLAFSHAYPREARSVNTVVPTVRPASPKSNFTSHWFCLCGAFPHWTWVWCCPSTALIDKSTVKTLLMTLATVSCSVPFLWEGEEGAPLVPDFSTWEPCFFWPMGLCFVLQTPSSSNWVCFPLCSCAGRLRPNAYSAIENVGASARHKFLDSSPLPSLLILFIFTCCNFPI